MDLKKLSQIINLLEIDQSFDLRLINGSNLRGRHTLLHSPEEHAFYEFGVKEFKKDLFLGFVKKVYSEDYEITLVSSFGIDKFQIDKVNVFSIPEKKLAREGGWIYFPACLESKSLTSFVELIAHLRAPDGCPWDKKQTHETLRTNLLEEAYEVLEAIDKLDMQSLEEELGDLLLQIVLQSQIAAEEGGFNMYDVIGGIHNKIVFRHPHVFSDWDVKDTSSVMRNWEILKSQERDKKNDDTKKNLLDSVPKSLPALSLAQKYQERAARVGFDWPEIGPVIEKIEEEFREFREAQDASSRERELGDLLFAIVNLIRWYSMDAESVLRQMNQRFLKRFSFIENMVSSQGKKMTDLTLAEMDEIWELAKLNETKSAQNGR